MADTSLTIYRKSILRLVRTLRMKSSIDAIAMNQGIPYKVDEHRPETWPYYMHLAGQYHPVDKIMRVISFDTREEIDFTYDNLLKHRATYDAYQIGTLDYRELVNRYPDQEDLIQGILNPIPTSVSIPAKDFQILYYDPKEVEAQETNLIPELQERIYRFVDKYYFHRYCITEDLYQAGFWGVLASQIILMIRNIRKMNVRTEFVHSFYIWSYLGSHQRLNVYRDYLTHDQVMWLYKRIRTLEANAGKTETFEELINKLITRRTIPLTSYEIWHTTENVPENVFSEAEMAKIPLNNYAVQPFGIEKSTIVEVLEKEINIAPRNKEVIEEKRISVPYQAKILSTNKQNTKVLESEMIDRTDGVPHKLPDVLFNHWLYWAATNKYTSVISVVHPSSQELISMTVKEAAILWFYCLYRTYDNDIVDIPTFLATKVARPTIPTFEELRGIADPSIITNDMIHIAMHEYTPVGKIISIEEFFGKASSVYRNIGRHEYLFGTRDTNRARGYFELICNRHYQDYRCKFIDEPMSYTQWFKLKNWQMDNLTKKQYKELGAEILNLSTGGNLRKISSVSEIQAAMIRITQQLSSYSIQFLRKINESPATIIDFIVPRLEEERLKTHDKNAIKLGIDVDTENRLKSKFDAELGIGSLVGITDAKASSNTEYRIDSSVDFSQKSRIKTHQFMKAPRIYVDVSWSPDINEVLKKSKLDGLKLRYAKPKSIDLDNPKLEGLKLYRHPRDTRVQMNKLFNSFVLGGFDLDRHPNNNIVLDAFTL